MDPPFLRHISVVKGEKEKRKKDHSGESKKKILCFVEGSDNGHLRRGGEEGTWAFVGWEGVFLCGYRITLLRSTLLYQNRDRGKTLKSEERAQVFLITHGARAAAIPKKKIRKS